jgi:hypothetical protein
MDMAEMKKALSAEVYQILVDALPKLGYVGERPCHSE